MSSLWAASCDNVGTQLLQDCRVEGQADVVTDRVYITQTPKKSTLFSGQYLRNHWSLDIGFLGYIGIVWPKEHSPEVRSFPPGTPCMCIYIYIYTLLVTDFEDVHIKIYKYFLNEYLHGLKKEKNEKYAFYGTQNRSNRISRPPPPQC